MNDRFPNEEAHAELQALIPWYVTGALDAAEQARIASHVAGCADCQAEVDTERELRQAVNRLTFPAEHGWADMRRRLKTEAANERAARRPAPRRASWGSAVALGTAPAWMAWAMAASVAVVAGVTGYGLAPRGAPDGAYHALGSPTRQDSGNVIVILRPDLREEQLRGLLTANHARLTDGPTAAGAYVLQAPPAERAEVLARLRANPGVVLAQPIDPTP